MKVIAIGGEPGSGKSTLMNKILDQKNSISEMKLLSKKIK